MTNSQGPPARQTPTITVPAPPALPEREPASAAVTSALPMLAGVGSMMMLAGVAGGVGQGRSLVAGGLFAISGIGVLLAQLLRQRQSRARRIASHRANYVRELDVVRRTLRTVMEEQRSASTLRHPRPGAWTAVPENNLWARTQGAPHFGVVRLGTTVCPLHAAVEGPESSPGDGVDPYCMRAAHDLIDAHAWVPLMPATVDLRAWDEIVLTGSRPRALGLARALLVEAIAAHPPESLRVVVLCDQDRRAGWDWLKWAPHALSPTHHDMAGPLRMVLSDPAQANRMVGELDAPLVLLVVDGSACPVADRPAGVTVVTIDSSTEIPALSARQLKVELNATTGPGTADNVTPSTAVEGPVRASQCGAGEAEAVARLVGHRAATVHDTATGSADQVMDLADLFGAGCLTEFDPKKHWSSRSSDSTMQVPIGCASDGSRLHLDLKESAYGGSGPHGLVIGATGSGKSELLRTLALGLAMQHSPDELAMVLIDFKGGATFSELAVLPHVSAVVTNLADDLALVDRMQDALTGELTRRQEVLHSSGHPSRHAYESARRHQPDLPPLPSLFICVDEFSELLAARPEFVDVFVAIGRLGRSLGLHLLLASQRLEEGRLRGLESHLSYRIGLRTFSAAESRAAIGVPDAHSLPSTPGAGYLRTGADELVRFTAAYVSGPLVPSITEQRAPLPVMLPWTLSPLSSPSDRSGRSPVLAAPPTVTASPQPSQLEFAVATMVGKGRTHAVWLPPLNASPGLGDLLPDLGYDSELGAISHHWRAQPGRQIPVGVVDRPREQRRDPLVLDLSGGGAHLAVVGRSHSGKSALLRTVVATLALTRTPYECQFILLDQTGGGLDALSQLPHVVGVAERGEPDLVRRLVEEVGEVMARRETYFREHDIATFDTYLERRAAGTADDGYGELFVVVDGWGALRAEFEPQEEALRQWAEKALSLGVHLVLATHRWNDLRPTLRDLIGSRIELRLGDPLDSELDRRAAATVPADRPGRGLLPGPIHLLTTNPALHRDSGDAHEAAASLARQVDALWTGPRVARTESLPTRVDLAALREVHGSSTHLLLGISDRSHSPATLAPSTDPHLLVRGGDRCGRTTALRTYLSEVTRTRTPAEVAVVLLDPRGSLDDAVDPDYVLHHLTTRSSMQPALAGLADHLRGRIPGPDVASTTLRTRGWWSGAEVFVVIDDHDVVTAGGWQESGLHLLAPLLPMAAEIGLHVLVAQRDASGGTTGYRSSDPLVGALEDLGVPTLTMGQSPSDPFGGRSHPPSFAQAIPGRGRLVVRGMRPCTLQMALPIRRAALV